MKLLLDLGNSRCKYAVLNPDAPDEYDALAYYDGRRLEAIVSVLEKYEAADRVVLCSVLGQEVNDQLQQWLAANKPGEFYFLDTSVRCFGISIGYEDPSTLGADRLAALIAAHDQFQGSTCIVDCGTAVTVDVLDQGGIHRGGIIFPGVRSMHAALLADTDMDVDHDAGHLVMPANSTRDAIYTGCLSAVAGGIVRIVHTMQGDNHPFDQVILTGGDAEFLLPLLSQNLIHKPHWVLEGLKCVCRRIEE